MTRGGNDPRRDRRHVRQQLRGLCRELNESLVVRDRGSASTPALCTCSTVSPATMRHLRMMLRVRQAAEARLSAELQELRAAADQSRVGLALAERMITRLRGELEEAHLSNAALQTTVARLERVMAWSQERVAGRADLLVQIRGKFNALQRDHATCAERVSAIRTAARAEHDRLLGENDALASDVEAARMRIAAATGEVSELRTQLTTARADRVLLGTRIETTEVELRLVRQHLANSLDELRGAYLQRDALKQEFAASVGANKDVIRFLNDRLTAAEKRATSLDEQRETAQRERAAITKERDALAADLAKMTDERDELRARVETLPEHGDELRAFQRKLFAREAQLIAQERHLAMLIDQQKRALEDRFIKLAKGA